MGIIIIGAGPIGCFLGSILAKAGEDVSIYEQKSVIGKPVQCTGIVTQELGRIIEVKNEFVVNKLKKVKIFSKNNTTELPIDDVVIDRAKFDKYLAKKAKKQGAKIYLNHKFLGIIGGKAVIADKNNKIKAIKADAIVGADGPLSEVAKANLMFRKRNYYYGIQARVKGNFDKNCYSAYFGSICPDFFAWIVPESGKIARIGVAGKKNVKELFNKFVKGKIIDYQAGLIPIYDKKLLVQREKVYLIGDAAGHVKATTGGGLVYGLKAAKILANCILYGKDYKKELKKINKELRIHLKIRRILDKFSDKDYNNLIKLMKNKRIKKILKEYDRDNVKKLIFKTILNKPMILKYFIKFIK